MIMSPRALSAGSAGSVRVSPLLVPVAEALQYWNGPVSQRAIGGQVQWDRSASRIRGSGGPALHDLHGYLLIVESTVSDRGVARHGNDQPPRPCAHACSFAGSLAA